MSADVERVAEAPAELEEIIGVDGLTDGLTAYERDRQERIKRNHAALDALGVRQAAMAVNLVVETGNVARKKATKRKEKLPKEETVAPMPAKRSRRLLGAPAENDENAGEGQMTRPPPELPLEERVMTCAEYVEFKGLEKGHLCDGQFKGWVEEAVCKRIGVASTAEEHWATFGGNVQIKPPKGQQAKEFAKTQLKSNPNQYFYRWNEPGETQAEGEWSEEEIQRFVEVAKKHGCGNKWGLFASYIPRRVGYQCSAAYRNIMLPRGLLLDNNFRMTADGKTRWVGGRGGGGGGDE